MFATLSFPYCAKSIPQKFQSQAQPKPSLKCLIMKLHVTKNERKRESEGGVSVTLHLNLPFFCILNGILVLMILPLALLTKRNNLRNVQ